jgi:hypothetical protein
VKFKLFPILANTRPNYLTISFDQLVKEIKIPRSGISEARAFRAIAKNHPEYIKFKKYLNACYAPNEYNGNSTGFIYLDIDGFQSTEEAVIHRNSVVKHPFVAACWLSLSNLGLSILVKVDNLTKDNYDHYYDQLNLFFENRLDTGARGFNKVNCISYDPTVYVNSTAIPFIPEEGCSSSIYKNNNNNRYCTPTFTGTGTSVIWQTRLSDSEYVNVNTPVVYKDGIDIIKLDLWRYKVNKIPIGKRNSTIGSISLQLIVLNPKVERTKLLNSLLSINKNYCIEALSKNEVIKIFNDNYSKFLKGEVDTSKYLKKKKVFFHTDCKIPKNDRISIALTELHKANGRDRASREQLINETIELLQDGNPITKLRIAETAGISIDTVKRYWKPFKNLIEQYNKGCSTCIYKNLIITSSAPLSEVSATAIPKFTEPVLSNQYLSDLQEGERLVIPTYSHTGVTIIITKIIHGDTN